MLSEGLSDEVGSRGGRGGRLGWWDHALIRSNLLSPFLALLYLFLFFWLVVAAANLAGSGDRASLFYVSLCGAVLCYFACGRLAMLFVSFGTELGGPPPYRMERLWRLAARYYGVSGFIVFVAAPVVAGLGPGWFGRPVGTNGWVLPVSLVLLHWLFGVAAVYHSVAMEARPIQFVVWLVFFPFRILGLVISFPMLLLVVFPIKWAAQFFGLELSAVIYQVLSRTDAALQWLATLDGFGPAVVYLLNPLYLALALPVNDGLPPGSVLAFPGVTVLLLGVIVVRLRRLFFSDWRDGYAAFYAEWLENRFLLAHQVAKGNVGPDGPALGMDEEDMPADGEAVRGAAAGIGARRVSAGDMTLPRERADAFVARLTVPSAPLLTGGEIAALVIALFAIPAFGEGVFVALLTLWLVITCGYDFPAGRHCWILPQRVWPVLGLVARRRVVPYWAGDGVLAVLMVLLLQGEWLTGMALFGVLVLFRLAILGAKLMYAMQSAVFFVAGVSLLIHIVVGALSVIYTINPERGSGTSPALPLLLIVLIALAVQWTATWLVLHWKYNHLLHYQAPRGHES